MPAAFQSVKIGANFIIQFWGNGAIKKVKNFLIKIGSLLNTI